MRTKHLATTLFLLATITLIGAGCAKKAPESKDTTTGNTGKISDTCGNPYYPFKSGLAIAYKVTPSTGAAGDSDYTLSIVKVKGTTATIRVELSDGATVDMEADCANGSVALKGSSNLSTALEGVKFKTTVVSSSGTFMPANVSAGSTWSNSETTRMEMTGAEAASLGPITLTAAENSRAVGEESVTVPAGTYNAIKVEVTRTTTSEFSNNSAIKIPSSTSKSTEWWVKGIGMVKTVTITDGDISTIEAKSVTGQ